MKYIIVPILLTVAVLFATSYQHEQAHEAAYSYKGYHNNTIGFDVLAGRMYTINHDEITPEDRDQIYQAQMMIEAVGYNNTIPFMVIILLVLLIIGFMPTDRRDDNTNRGL